MYLQKNFLILIFFLSSTILCAQQTTSSAGGIISSQGGQISFIVGQINYTNVGSKEFTTGGVLQVVQRLFNNEMLLIKVGPNPVVENLTIQIDGTLKSDIFYQVFDLFGHELDQKKIIESYAVINMKDYLPGIFILLINSTNQAPIPFKIIKL